MTRKVCPSPPLLWTVFPIPGAQCRVEGPTVPRDQRCKMGVERAWWEESK